MYYKVDARRRLKFIKIATGFDSLYSMDRPPPGTVCYWCGEPFDEDEVNVVPVHYIATVRGLNGRLCKVSRTHWMHQNLVRWCFDAFRLLQRARQSGGG